MSALLVHSGVQMGSLSATDSVLSYSKYVKHGEYEQEKLANRQNCN
jgi:hypothetical protein